jgi:Trypsin
MAPMEEPVPAAMSRHSACRASRRRLLATVALMVAASLVVPALAAGAASHPAGKTPAKRRSREHRRADGKSTRAARAHAAIVGGREIGIESAPWQVEVLVKSKDEGFRCSGSILDATHILTAGHCAFTDGTHQQIEPEAFEVFAGTPNFLLGAKQQPETEQVRAVASVDPHPYYDPAKGGGEADDVAVLTLAEPLSETAAVRPIALPALGLAPAEGAPLALTGFGTQSASASANGRLYAIEMALGSPECGGEVAALFLCASTPSGSLCFGDSGSALTLAGSPAVELGVTDTVETIGRLACFDGAIGGFANLAAPEIHDFIEGVLDGVSAESERPPRAPRGGERLSIAGVPWVGESLACSPGAWANNPSFTYAFIDDRSEQVLQEGPVSSYALTAADLGRTISCRLRASNEGGTAVLRTGALRAVETAPIHPEPVNLRIEEEFDAGLRAKSTPQPVPQAKLAPMPAVAGRLSLASTVIAVHGHVALVKLRCAGGGSCSARLTFTARRTLKVRGAGDTPTVTVATASESLAAGRAATVKITLNAAGRALLAAGHGHLVAKAKLAQSDAGAAAARVESVQLVAQKTRAKRG